MSVTYDGGSESTFKPSASFDGLGIALDLGNSPAQFEDSSPSSTPRSHSSSPQFPVLSNVSHVVDSPAPVVVAAVEPLRFESSRDRLVRTRASISAPSDYVTSVKPRGANRADVTKCYTLATYSPASDPVSISRPPKSALRTKPSAPAPAPSEPSPPLPPPRAVAAWTSRSAPSSRKTSLVVSSSSTPAPAVLPSAGLYCLRPTVNVATQTPEWNEDARKSRRFSASTPPQAYSSFNGMFGAPPASSVRQSTYDITPPSPSVYSIASVDTHRGGGGGHRKGESHSSFYAFKLPEGIREREEEDLQAVIDRHLGELEESQAVKPPSIAVGYDVPFLDPSPYDTPQLRPFEIPATPLAVPLATAYCPSPALNSQAPTPTLDRTPTLPQQSSSLRTDEPVSPTQSFTRAISPSSSSSTFHGSENDESISTPPTSAASSTFEDVSIQLAEQEPIQIRKASLISSASSRKSSLVPCESRRQSLHSRSSSISAKSVKFNLVEPSEQGSVTQEEEEDVDEEPPTIHYVSTLRRRSESDKPIQRNSSSLLSREERAAKGRSFFLVQALMGEEIPKEGMIRDWARDTEDEAESDDEGSIADSEM